MKCNMDNKEYYDTQEDLETKEYNDSNKCHETNKHNPMKHIIHMVICCGLPIIILLSLPWIAGLNAKAATVLGFIAPFICPVMMGGMMFMMFKGKNDGRTKDQMIENREESLRK